MFNYWVFGIEIEVINLFSKPLTNATNISGK